MYCRAVYTSSIFSHKEMVLSAAIALDSPDFKDHDVIFLSLGTDGIDGPTDVAGAVADQCLLQVARLEGIKNAVQYLLDNNSYEFFSCLKGGQNFIKIGHTGTNVMDIQLLVIRPKISKMHAFGAKEM
jgi:glycerate kinase